MEYGGKFNGLPERKRDTAGGRTAYDLYAHGDCTIENTAVRVVNGTDDLLFVEKGGLGSETRYGQTVQNGRGGRTITIADMGHADNVVTLGHEAYRNGVAGENNGTETAAAVIVHTELADRMRSAGHGFNSEGVAGLDLAVYDYARSVGDMSIMNAYPDYVLGNIKTQPFKDVYNGDRTNRFRKALSESKDGMFPGCLRCYSAST
jgi:hypothetical protein